MNHSLITQNVSNHYHDQISQHDCPINYHHEPLTIMKPHHWSLLTMVNNELTINHCFPKKKNVGHYPYKMGEKYGPAYHEPWITPPKKPPASTTLNMRRLTWRGRGVLRRVGRGLRSSQRGPQRVDAAGGSHAAGATAVDPPAAGGRMGRDGPGWGWWPVVNGSW